MPSSIVQIIGEKQDIDYTDATKDAINILRVELENVQGCDSKNFAQMVSEYMPLTLLEYIYMLYCRSSTFIRFKDYEESPGYVSDHIIKDMIQHPSKYPMVSYTSIGHILFDWIIENSKEAFDVVIGDLDLKNKQLTDFEDIFYSFERSKDTISDENIDICFRLGWVIWHCSLWWKDYKEIFQSYTSFNDEELKIFKDKISHLIWYRYEYDFGRRTNLTYYRVYPSKVKSKVKTKTCLQKLQINLRKVVKNIKKFLGVKMDEDFENMIFCSH